MDDAVRPNPRTMRMAIELGMNLLVLVMIDDRVLNVRNLTRNLTRNKDRDLIGIIVGRLIIIPVVENEIGIKSAPESKIIMTILTTVIMFTVKTIAIIVTPMIKTTDMTVIAITIIRNNQ